MENSFPVEEFDAWAEHYDHAVAHTRGFPFDGYEAVLDAVVRLASLPPGTTLLDLGIGTGNLAVRFAALGCEIWGTDFSAPMLEKARLKLPHAHLFQFDLRADWPETLDRRFGCIVSGYVFHHFEFQQKIAIAQKLVRANLEPGGRLLIADIAFPDRAALEIVKGAAGDDWEEEFYWLADEILPALTRLGLDAKFYRVSSCAGIFEIK